MIRFSPPNWFIRLLLVLVLCAGVLIVFFARHAALALAGFALMGMGTSVLFPLAMSAAAQRTDRPAAINVAALAQTAFGTFLLAPPALGFVAQHLGVRWAFGIGLPLTLLSLAVTGVLRPAGRTGPPVPPPSWSVRAPRRRSPPAASARRGAA